MFILGVKGLKCMNKSTRCHDFADKLVTCGARALNEVGCMDEVLYRQLVETRPRAAASSPSD
jgi:hypothetical protein